MSAGPPALPLTGLPLCGLQLQSYKKKIVIPHARGIKNPDFLSIFAKRLRTAPDSILILP